MSGIAGYSLVLVVTGVVFTATVLHTLFTGFTGPLAALPGPLYTKFTSLPLLISTFRGTRTYYLRDLHLKYGGHQADDGHSAELIYETGGFVRVSPTEVSVADPDAAKAIHKIGSGFLKAEFYERFNVEPLPTIFSARDPHVHSKWRRLLAQPLLESNLKSLEPLVQSKVDLLISKLKAERAQKGVMNLYAWLHYFAVDVISDLSFGEPSGMLEKGEDDEYVKLLQKIVGLVVLRTAMTSRPKSETERIPFWPFSRIVELQKKLIESAFVSLGKYQKHAAASSNARPMLFDKVMGEKGRQAGVSMEEVAYHAQIYLVAGSDTTAVSIVFLIWSILQRPEVRTKLFKAMKDANVSESPTNDELRAIPYLEHLIDETFRVYPGVPSPLPRDVPKGGCTFNGLYIPEGTVVSPVAYVVHRDATLFPEPESWNPDRWENASKEMRDALLQFGGGSRICIGMHLARMEIRLATVAFMRNFAEAEIAYGVNGFQEKDMKQLDFFVGKPSGETLLVR